MSLPARCLLDGEAEGDLSVCAAPLSFWGGYDAASGRVVDRSHPAFAACLAGRILAMPSGRGSSSASSVLAEAIRRGTAPSALILAEPDPIIAVGAIVARRLYGLACPVVICAPGDLERLSLWTRARVLARPEGSAIHRADGEPPSALRAI